MSDELRPHVEQEHAAKIKEKTEKNLQSEEWWTLFEIAHFMRFTEPKADSLAALVLTEDVTPVKCHAILTEAQNISCVEDRAVVLLGLAYQIDCLNDSGRARFVAAVAGLPLDPFDCFIDKLTEYQGINAVQCILDYRYKLNGPQLRLLAQKGLC